MDRSRIIPGVVAGAVLLLSMLGADAAHRFVNANATGANDGSSWTNAWTVLHAKPYQPGDTIHIAGGAQYGFNIMQDSITAERASSSCSACTSSPGWNPSFDSQMIITVSYNPGWSGVRMEGKKNLVLDGKVPNGIKIIMPVPVGIDPVTTQAEHIYGVIMHGDNNIVRNVEVTCPTPTAGGNIGVCMRIVGSGSSGVATNMLASRCYLHSLNDGLFIDNANSCTVEFCDITDIYGNGVNHDNVAYIAGNQGGHTLRYNRVGRFASSGFYFAAVSWVMDNMRVYGNEFFDAPGGVAISLDPGGSSQYTGPGYQYGPNWFAINNSFRNVWKPFQLAGRWNMGGSQAGYATNNIIVGATPEWSNWTHDYNFTTGSSLGGSEAHGIINGSDPFVNAAGGDFHIVPTIGATYPRNNGAAVATTYQADRDGDTRGADGTVDIGADEYSTGGGGGLGSGTLQWQQSAYSTGESGTINLTVTRTGSTSGSIGCSYATASGSATSGQDFTGTSGTLTFSDGEVTKNVAITIASDSLVEGNETFTVTLSNPTNGGVLGTSTTATVTIVDDDYSPPTIPLHTTFPFLATNGLIAAPFSTSGGVLSQSIQTGTTNVAGTAQYRFITAATGLHTIEMMLTAPGDANNSLWVEVIAPDGGYTNDVYDIIPYATNALRSVNWRGTGTFDVPQFQPRYWYFTAGLTNGLVLFGREQGVSVSNIDVVAYSPPITQTLSFAQYPYTVAQSGNVDLVVSRGGGTSGEVSCAFATADGTAIAGTDYSTTSGTLTLEDGVSSGNITVPVVHHYVSTNRVFTVTLSSPTGANLVTPSTGQVTIQGVQPPLTPPARRMNLRTFKAGTVRAP